MVIYKVAIIFIVRYYNTEIFMISQEHDIVPSKYADVVINVVAGDSIEAFILKGEMDGVALLESDVGYAHRFCVVLAALLREDSLIRTRPDVASHYSRLRIPFGACDGQCAAAAAHVQTAAAVRELHICGRPLDDLPGQLPLPIIGKRPVQDIHPDCQHAEDKGGHSQNDQKDVFQRSHLHEAVHDPSGDQSNCSPAQKAAHHAFGYPIFIIRLHLMFRIFSCHN